MSIIPNLITAMNLLLGMVAMLFLVEGNMVMVLFCFVGALLADFLDGFVARALNTTSPLGAQLDSLADVVTFGVLPGFAAVDLLHEMGETTGAPFWLPLLGLMYPIYAAWRLAKFNVDTRESKDFFGLNTPSAAIAIMGLWYFGKNYGWGTFGISPVLEWIIVLLAIKVISVLCLTDLPMLSLKPSPRDRHRSMRQVGLVLGAAAVSLLYLPLAPFLAIALYIVFSAFHFITSNRR